MRIALEQTYEPEAARRLRGHDCVYFATRSDPLEKVRALTSTADIMVMRWPLTFPVDLGFLEACPRLKLLHKSGTGLEHANVIDLEALSDLGILFSNNAGINADVVAEHAVLLTLLCLRPDTLRQLTDLRLGVWDQEPPEGTPKPEKLAGRTVGIVGLGQIGTSLAIRYRAMGVSRILGYQRTPRFEHTVYGGVEWVGLHELLSFSDVVALCLPINATTRGLIGREEIALMRPSTSLINVGRGGVVDEAALFEALSQGRLRAAGLDVFAEEPSTSPLLGLPNVFATPHMAGTATEVQAMQIRRSIDAVEDFLLKREPRGLANAAVLSRPNLRAGWLRRAQPAS